ncbi:phosphopantetheine-binding protein [Streptomyces sp. NPDC050619]|uniref:phosphopantetheine-binding protein n=1 Tax=Streptomyces sp. NPDC050619 TaxID=3157214 RepID=UPI0034206426
MTNPWDDRFETLLRDALRFLPPDEALRPDLDTIAAGLDSMAIVELLLSVETAYDISMPDDFLQPDTFASPGALWEVVCAVRAIQSEPA